MTSPSGCERCTEAPNALLLEGVRLFNIRHYFECHEVLETAWNAEREPIRVLYKGILQVGVGCYHLLRSNYRGAIIKLASGADYLEPYAPRCMTVDVARLIADARLLREAVVAVGPEGTAAVDRTLLPIINLSS
jgi:uncharacterized protein